MSLSLTVYGKNLQKEEEWVSQLSSILQSSIEIQIRPGTKDTKCGQIVFVDGSIDQVDLFLEKLDRRGRAVFLVLDEKSILPHSLNEGKIDDVIVIPFRSLEVLSKIRHYERILMWNEVIELNASFSEALQKLSEDLGLAERLQKAKLPKRFLDLKGFRVASRYLAGMRSGGDYFDLAESKNGANLSIIMSHSSSYGLSTAILSVLMRVTLRLSLERMGKAGMATETVQKVHDELLLTLGEKDQLSLFYGNISRQDQVLRFLNLGGIAVFYADAEKSFEILPRHGGPISKTSGFSPESECEIPLSPDARLALVSDGFLTGLGGEERVADILNHFRKKDAVDSLNELTFNIKSKLIDKDDMPVQDCTALIFDVDSRVLKLTRPKQDES